MATLTYIAIDQREVDALNDKHIQYLTDLGFVGDVLSQAKQLGFDAEKWIERNQNKIFVINGKTKTQVHG